MRTREVDSFLQVKLQLEEFDGSNHVHYRFPKDLRIGLPTVLALSRGSGEVAHNNMKGLASGLGMRIDELLASVKCHISKAVVYLSLAMRLMAVISHRLAFDPEVHREGCKAMAFSITRLLKQVDPIVSVNKAERKVLARLREMLGSVDLHQFSEVRNEIGKLIEALLGSKPT